MVVIPHIEDAFRASSMTGATSFYDNICMLTAKRHGFTCVTNDKRLRNLCKRNGVSILCGLELIARVHKAGGMPYENALTLAQAIRAANPTHITTRLLSRFRELLELQQQSQSGIDG